MVDVGGEEGGEHQRARHHLVDGLGLPVDPARPCSRSRLAVTTAVRRLRHPREAEERREEEKREAPDRDG